MEPKEQLRKRVELINQLLGGIYGEPVRFSFLLKEAGLPTEQIQRIKSSHLSEFLLTVRQLWASYLKGTLPEKYTHVLVHRYLPLSHEIPTMAQLGEELGVTRARISQIQKKCVMRLRRSPKRRERLEELVVEAALSCLKIDPPRSDT